MSIEHSTGPIPADENNRGGDVLEGYTYLSQEEKQDIKDAIERVRVLLRENPITYGTDPYASHSGHFSAQDYIASQAFNLLLSRIVDHEDPISDQLPPERVQAVEGLAAAITTTAAKTARKLLFQASSDERETYCDPQLAKESQLKPFENQLRYLVARTVHEMNQASGMSCSNLEYLKNNLEIILDLLSEVPQLVEDVYATDIPLYEKVFDEFDRMKTENPRITEVYLARDGIFAYYGRRAQAAARAALIDPSQRSEMRATGEIHEYVPKYHSLLFNRAMMGRFDDLDIDSEDFSFWQQRSIERAKHAYLYQEGVNEETIRDMHFFDTGYEGTIPQDIMRLMGLPESEIDDHIHMLSASDKSRRSQGLRINHTLAVDEIEHDRPKAVKSAEGYHLNGVGYSGGVYPIQEPSSPEDIFNALIIREAIHRHFWIRERQRS